MSYSSFTINGSPANGSTLKIGDDHECVLVIYGDNDGASIDFVVKLSIDDADNAAIINKTGTEGVEGGDIAVSVVSNALTAIWSIASPETRSLPDNSVLVYGIQMRKGTKTKTIEEGTIKLSLDVVRTDD